MSEENTQTETQVETLEAAPVGTAIPVEAVAETVVTVVKRGRGRPKGSKNKPKDASAPAKEKKTVKEKVVVAKPEPAIVAAKVAPFVPDDTEEVVEAPVEASSDE